MTEKQTPNWADWFYYSPTSPTGLRWKVAKRKGIGSPGDVAGGDSGKGYWVVQVKGKRYYVHRIVYELVNAVTLDASTPIDHKNGVRTDNTASNLRAATPALNARNQKLDKRNLSGKSGVLRCCRKSKEKYPYWHAVWYSDAGNRVTKSFSVLKHGEEMAKQLAVKAREAAMQRLIEGGAGYTERHGT